MALTRNQKLGIGGGAAATLATTAVLFLAVASGITNARTGTDYGTDLQSAINAAQTGDTLEMNGTEAVCNCFDYKGLTIQGGTVKTPNATPAMYYPPKTPGAALKRMKFTTDPNWSQVHEIVKYGDYGGEIQDQFDEQPQGLVIEDTEVICGPMQNCQRGVSANGKNFSFIRSKILNVHFIGVEAQGLISTNGTGPFKIIDAYIEGAGENAMWGGNDPAIQGLVADGIELTRVHLFKPLSWNPYDRDNFVPLNGEAVTWSTAGRGAWVRADGRVASHWGVKNLLEFKNAKNVVIDGLLAENCWGDAQIGFGVLFTVRNQNGKAPWSVLKSINMKNSIVRNVAGGFQLIGKDSPNISEQSSDLTISNSVIELAPAGGPMGPNGRLMQLQQYNNVTVENIEANAPHTFLNITGANADGSLQVNEGLIYRKNLLRHGEYGLFTDGAKPLTSYAPGAVVAENWIYGTPTGAAKLPGNTYFGEKPTVAPAGIGVDYAALQAAQPKPSSSPSPSPSATATATVSPSPILSPQPSPTAPESTSPDNFKGPAITDSSGNKWVLGVSRETLRNGQHMADGFGIVYKWLSGTVYVQGTDANTNWYRWRDTRWEFIGPEPQPNASPTPSATATATGTPTPAPTQSPTPQPTATVAPSPSPVASPLPTCPSGARPGNPPRCRCRNNAPVRPNGKCP